MICPMSDETVTSFQEGHAACPFVAFEDDRDHRADNPDYRHRCFAAAEPEPRALPHQERFCLSAAFAQCPIFLDWARQEAAGVVTKNAAGASAATVQPATAAARTAAVETPAFLASHARTTPAEAGAVTPHATSDPGSGLWGFEGAPKRSVASLAAPAAASSDPAPGTLAYTMARRQPSHPDWEKPPRLDNYPRLRAREERNNNQPLLLAAVGVAVLFVALILLPLLGGKGGGLVGSSGSANPSGSGSFIAGGPSSSLVTDTPLSTPQADRTLLLYPIGTRSWDKNLTLVAQHFGISLTQLELANPAVGPVGSPKFNVIRIGDQFFIPWQTWTPPAPTPSPTPTMKATPTPTATL
jgi:hypothetical protein